MPDPRLARLARTRRPARRGRGGRRISRAARRRPHARARRGRRSSAAVGAVPAASTASCSAGRGSSLGVVAPRPRAALLAARGDRATTTTSSTARDGAPGRRPRRPAARRPLPGPSFRPILVVDLRWRSCFSAWSSAGWLLARRRPDARDLAAAGCVDARREYRAVVIADATGHLATSRGRRIRADARGRSPSCSSGRRPADRASCRRAVGEPARAGGAGSPGPGGAGGGVGRAGRVAPAAGPGGRRHDHGAEHRLRRDDRRRRPAGKPFTITFHNNDAGTPHNVVDPRGLGRGRGLQGRDLPGRRDRSLPGHRRSRPARYTFVCDVHPTMTGRSPSSSRGTPRLAGSDPARPSPCSSPGPSSRSLVVLVVVAADAAGSRHRRKVGEPAPDDHGHDARRPDRQPGSLARPAGDRQLLGVVVRALPRRSCRCCETKLAEHAADGLAILGVALQGHGRPSPRLRSPIGATWPSVTDPDGSDRAGVPRRRAAPELLHRPRGHPPLDPDRRDPRGRLRPPVRRDRGE